MTIPNSVTTIKNSAFSGCTSLTSVVIPNSIISIGSSAFANCIGLKNITIPNSVITIGASAFYQCSNLESIVIPRSVTTINDYAFAYCSNLMSITFNNYTYSMIQYGVFKGCDKITSLTLGESITKFGFHFGQTGLTTLYSFNPIPPDIAGAYFTNNQYMTMDVFVPQEALTAYQRAKVWNNFWNMQGFDPTRIGNVKTEGKEDNFYYDLNGNRLDAPKRGVNIINGKKVIIK